MLDFLKKIKNKKNKQDVQNLKTHDIKIIPHKNIILFKNKEWKIEITKTKIFEFLYKFKFLISGLFVFLVIILLLFYFKGKAETAQFYPESCLGGWQNPQNAQGKPDLKFDAQPEDFNESNSAVLKNIISEIYCGNFKGNVLENTIPKKAFLKFSWLIEEGEKKEIIINNSSTKNNNENLIETSTLIQVINLSSTTPTTTEEKTQSNNDLSNSSSTDNNLSSSSSQNLDNQSSTNNNLESQIVPESLEQTPQPTESSTNTNNQIIPDNSNLDSSFWNKLFKIVFAQSSENSIEQINQSTSENEVDLNNNLNASSADMNLNNLNSIDVITSSIITNSTGSIENSNLDLIENTSTLDLNTSLITDDIFEIFYTFDGASWQSLGKVNFSNWKNLKFEIPDFDWSKLDKLQIKIQSISPKEYNLTAYLDGIILEIEYDFLDNSEEINYKISELDNLDLNNILKIKGINNNLAISILKIEDNYYVVLIDLDKNKFYKIYLADFDSPVGIKNNLVFWKKEKRIFYLDPLNFKLYAKKFTDFDKSRGERAEIKFTNLNFKIIFDGNNFYFKDPNLGEIFSEENGYVLESFRKKFEVDKILDKEKISNLGFIIEENEEN